MGKQRAAIPAALVPERRRMQREVLTHQERSRLH